MKLCDRCPQAGSCLLNYLGKACHKLRMQECPEVVPTTLELMHNFIDLAGYAACAGEIVTERSCLYEKAETQTQE